MIDDIVSQASSATSIAQSVRDDADSGAFDGASVVGLEIVLNHLICTLSDGTEIDAGVIPGALSDAVSKSAQAAKDSTMTQPVGVDSDGKLWSVPGGTSDHDTLTNRDASNQHPISAITNLSSELSSKVSKSAQATKDSTMTQEVGIDSDGKLWSVPGGTSNYEDLNNLPQINSVTLTGNKSFEDLGLEQEEAEEYPIEEANLIDLATSISSASTDDEVASAKAVYDFTNGKIDKSAQAAKDSTMTQAVGIDSDGKLWSVPGGTSDHNALTNRDASDQHPISAITNLSTSLNEKYVKPQNGIPVSDLEDGIIPDTEEATEVEVPLYTITDALDVSVALKNYDTTVFSDGAVSTITAALPTPVSGNDYLTGVIFEAASGQTFTVTCPTGYALKWIGNAAPMFTAGKIYEIIFRCLWLSDGSGDIIISANWSEV